MARSRTGTRGWSSSSTAICLRRTGGRVQILMRKLVYKTIGAFHSIIGVCTSRGKSSRGGGDGSGLQCLLLRLLMLLLLMLMLLLLCSSVGVVDKVTRRIRTRRAMEVLARLVDRLGEGRRGCRISSIVGRGRNK